MLRAPSPARAAPANAKHANPTRAARQKFGIKGLKLTSGNNTANLKSVKAHFSGMCTDVFAPPARRLAISPTQGTLCLRRSGWAGGGAIK
jgi:hypothetical protein